MSDLYTYLLYLVALTARSFIIVAAVCAYLTLSPAPEGANSTLDRAVVCVCCCVCVVVCLLIVVCELWYVYCGV